MCIFNNIKKKAEMKRFERSMQKLKDKIDRLNAEISARLPQSHTDLINAIFCEKIRNEQTDVDHIRKRICRIDQETGEYVDYFLYFENYSPLDRIKYYLEAYKLTNKDVLEQKELDELTELIKHFD
jgi:antitoxin component HigA of HigAB toxin-antitoxin module